MTKAKQIFTIVVGLVMGVVCTGVGTKELIDSRHLATRGKTTTAQVVRAEEWTRGRLRWHSYYLTVEFRTAGGGSVRQKMRTSRSVFATARRSGLVNVYYLPEDPRICALGETVQIPYRDLLFGVVFMCGAVCVAVFFKQPVGKEEMVKTIEKHFRNLAQTDFEHAPVDARKFRHLDLKFYDEGRGYLEQRGYRFLGDEDNVTLRGAHTFARVLLSRDQTVAATLYHYQPGLRLRIRGVKASKTLDLETWFANGCFVCTSNAENAGKLDSPPSVDAAYLPAATTWNAVVEAHEGRVAGFLSKHPGIQAIRLSGLDDVHRAEDELQRIKAEYRRQTGISKAELERLTGAKGPEVDELHAILAERHQAQHLKP